MTTVKCGATKIRDAIFTENFFCNFQPVERSQNQRIRFPPTLFRP
jgi:hypothetical protein